jgi:hypothetical protein
MKNKTHLFILFFILSLVLVSASSCAHRNPESSGNGSLKTDTEADVDGALGVLSKRKTEAQKQLDELKAEKAVGQEDTTRARREQEEEQRRLHRNVTEDIIREQPTTT